MKLKERIQLEKADALKSGNKDINVLLSSVLGEMDRISKDPSEEESVKIIKKMIESSNECKNYNDALYLKMYLPTQHTELELKNIIENFVYTQPTAKLGDIMKYLKENYNGTYDGKSASQISLTVINDIVKQ